VLDTAAALAALDGGSARQDALPHLADLLGAEVATHHRLDLRARTDEAVAYPHGALPAPDSWPAYQEQMPQHPLIRHYATTRDPAPRKISDFLTPREFRALPLYAEYYRLVPAEDQLALALPTAAGSCTHSPSAAPAPCSPSGSGSCSRC
jgi:hypothetical protein